MDGQYTIWDIHDGPVRKPCEYSFPRYIGQRVVFWRDGLQGVITEIGPYYTTVNVGDREYVGTPTTIAPVKEGEWTDR